VLKILKIICWQHSFTGTQNSCESSVRDVNFKIIRRTTHKLKTLIIHLQ